MSAQRPLLSKMNIAGNATLGSAWNLFATFAEKRPTRYTSGTAWRCAGRAGWEMIDMTKEQYEEVISALVEKIRRIEAEKLVLKYENERLKEERNFEK